MAEAIVHDAARGFHDIKAVPEFYAAPIEMTSVAVTTMLLAAAALYWFFRTRQSTGESEQSLDPLTVQLSELERLAALPCLDEDQFRERCANVSLRFRYGLEALFGLRAADRTADELRREIEAFRTQQSPLRLHKPLEQAAQLVHALERGTYSARVPTDYARIMKEKSEFAATLLRTMQSQHEQLESEEEARNAV